MPNKDFLLTFRSTSQLQERAMLEAMAQSAGVSMAEVLRRLIVGEFERLGLELPAEAAQVDGLG